VSVLTADIPIVEHYAKNLRPYPVADGKTIYKGGLTFTASGEATDTSNSGANQFVGICFTAATETEICVVYASGDFRLSIVGVDQTSVGKAVYATDSNGATMTATNARYIGTCTKYDRSGVGWVAIDTQNRSQVDNT